MELDRLIRNPGFQLNLLLWMAKEQPEGCEQVRPLFAELGLRLLSVEKPFPLPEEMARQIGEMELEISTKPEPELILQRPEDGKALYFEAKASSFGPDSSTARQARGHLLACGPAFAEVLTPLRECLLCYVLPDDQTAQMAACLSALAGQLTDAGLEPGKTSLHGFAVQDGSRLAYVWDCALREFLGLEEETCVAILLEAEDGETDPCPLILVYSDEDYPDPESKDLFRQAFLRRVHTCLLCGLHLNPALNTPIPLVLEELLMETTEGVYEYMGRDRRRSLRSLVNERILRRIRDYWEPRAAGLYQREQGEVVFRFASQDVRDRFLDWLEREEFGGAAVPRHQDTLFDAMGADGID